MFVKIPTYKISADETEETIDMIAVTSNPAIMIKGVKLSAQTQRPAIMQFATDKERMIIAGPALIPNMEIYRNDEDGEYNVMFTEEVVAQLVEKFAKQNGSSFNVEHTDKSAPLFVLEHWIVEDPEMDKCRTFGFTDLPKGTWFVMAKVSDKNFWENEVKKQGKLGFSIEGLLGLKLTKNIMKKEFKKTNRFNAIRKFEAVDGVTPEDVTVTVSADALAVDEAVVVVDENMEAVEDYSGELTVEGELVTIAEGVITAVEPVATEVVEAAEEVVEKEEDVPAAEETEVEAAEEDAPAVAEEVTNPGVLDEAAILALIQPKLDEIYAAIAAIQIESQAPEAGAAVELTAMERKLQALALMNSSLK